MHRRAARTSASRPLAAVVAVATLMLSACGGQPPAPSVATAATPAAAGSPAAPASPAGSAADPAAAGSAIFPHGLLIADRGNGRLIVVNDAGTILWSFPGPDSFPTPTPFNADDAFFSPDGRTLTANDEDRDVIYRIDIATRRVIWSYGHAGMKGSAPGYLNTPDDAYPLANGDIVVADINNCRIIQIAPDRSIVRQWGRTGICRTAAPATFGAPNGDTPLPDGGLLVTQINGARVERLAADGSVLWDIHVPVTYPSDAQLDANGNVIVAEYTDPGAVVSLTPGGTLLWRYAPMSGSGRMIRPSLATPLPNGLVSINDDDRNRIIVLDPRTMRIVWQFGVTDRAGGDASHLSDPDGHEPVPTNVVLPGLP